MTWPTSLDLIPPVSTGQPISEFVENEQTAAINGIEQNLGLNPQGSSANVASALAAILVLQAVPAGAILPHAGASAPAGYLICDGSSVSQTTYAALYAVIGVTFGGGGGNFNLPNLSGQCAIGTSGTHGYASAGGADTVSLTTTNLPSHSHQLSQFAYLTPGVTSFHNNSSLFCSLLITNPSTTDTIVGVTPHNNLQPYLVVNFIIKT